MKHLIAPLFLCPCFLACSAVLPELDIARWQAEDRFYLDEDNIAFFYIEGHSEVFVDIELHEGISHFATHTVSVQGRWLASNGKLGTSEPQSLLTDQTQPRLRYAIPWTGPGNYAFSVDWVAVDDGVPMFRPNQTVVMTVVDDDCPPGMACTDDSASRYHNNLRGACQRGTAQLAAHGRERLDGTVGDDVMYGQSGSDTIHGQACNDTIWGGLGRDRLFGDDGDDYIFGQHDDDHLYGGRGDDSIDGGQGDDVCYGGPGRDNFTSCRTVYPG